MTLPAPQRVHNDKQISLAKVQILQNVIEFLNQSKLSLVLTINKMQASKTIKYGFLKSHKFNI